MNPSRAGARLIWQRPEQLLQRDTLESVLGSSHRCWPHALPGGEASASLRGAGRLHVASVQRTPLKGGVSGAHLERLLVQVEIEGPAGRRREIVSLIFKRMRPDESWLMRASGDARCREVQLWQQGLLADAPRALCVPVLAAAYDEAAREGALLLGDMTHWLGALEDCFKLPPPGQWKQYLDHLARLHARYWQDARLKDERFALASVEQTLLMLAPATIQAQLAAGDAHPYLPVSRSGWETFFAYGPAAALSKVQRVIDVPAALLADAALAPATLLHGDAWPPNMGMLPGERGLRGCRAGSRTILIDWALATAGPASFDPFWLLFAWHAVDTRLALAYYRERLSQHLARRGVSLSTAEWLLLVDLGVVRTVMTCGESMGQDILFARSAARRARAIAALAWWLGWASRAIERRGWS
ncbi:MAG TPA: phosphotransferase [Ktedonobacterales bacterium]|nr:phosphotransferase [Ktedonobacterales bacterium]